MEARESSEGCVEEIGVWVVENDGGDGGLGCGQMRGERGADAGSVGDDLRAAGMERELVRYWQAASASWVMAAGWGGGGALAVASVVEGEDVDAEVVEGGEGGDGVGEGAVAVGEEEEGQVGVAGAGVGGDPPAGELGSGGLSGSKWRSS